MNHKPLVIAIVGPTASGKSELAVNIAKKLNGEIISADSRQVYRSMNIGTGKVAGRTQKTGYYYKGIRHFGIDIASPKTQYSAAKFQKLAQKTIAKITKQGKLPIICGGTGHWVDAAAFNQSFPEVKPNAKLRSQLSKKSTVQLFALLKKLDPRRASSIDAKNPRRLIRALEIVLTTNKPVPFSIQSSPYEVIWIGIAIEKNLLDKKIEKRLKERIKAGMIAEVKLLHDQGVSWKRLENFGLEYKFCARFIQNKITVNEFQTQLSSEIKQYAKRQLTWFKRNKDIAWVESQTQAFKIISKKLKEYRTP